jgi:hypothetical protein
MSSYLREEWKSPTPPASAMLPFVKTVVLLPNTTRFFVRRVRARIQRAERPAVVSLCPHHEHYFKQCHPATEFISENGCNIDIICERVRAFRPDLIVIDDFVFDREDKVFEPLRKIGEQSGVHEIMVILQLANSGHAITENAHVMYVPVQCCRKYKYTTKQK